MSEFNTKQAQEIIAERERRATAQRAALAAVDKATAAEDSNWSTTSSITKGLSPPPPAIKETVGDARERTHGDFSDTARIAQALKSAMRDTEASKWASLAPIQHEALESIATQIARILSGDANHVEHYLDIAGYAERVADRL
jgi:hypothetical protein